jgi:ubiquinone/menaquinone biosynthesis C-methylase UbiE
MSSMPANNVAFVGSVPENYDRYLGPVLFDPYAADLVARLSLPEDASVLELACGTGILTRRLRDRLGPRARLVASDLNAAMMDYASGKFRAEESVEWKQADATDLPFDDQSFDGVACQFGLMFFPDKERALRETYRLLKPGGVFLFSVWDKIETNDLPYIAHTIIAKFFDDKPPDFYEVPFSFHDPKTIKSLVSTTGFKQLQVSVLPLEAISPSARDVAKGLIHGNPVITAIKERDESRVPEIEAAVAAAVAARCGDAPVRGRMQALVCTAVR